MEIPAGAAGPDEMIRLDGISKRYPDGTVAVAHLDMVVPRGELVCLVGPSGCGKTTTMRMVNRLIEPTTGRGSSSTAGTSRRSTRCSCVDTSAM